MLIRVPTLDTAIVERERRELLARLSRDHDVTSADERVRLVHEAVDRGLPHEALALISDRPTDASEPSLAWATARARWDAGDRDTVRRAALRLAPHAGRGAAVGDRVIVRAAWIGALEGVVDPELRPLLEQVRERADRQQGPAAVLADLRHLDAYVALVHEARLGAALDDAALAAELYAFAGETASEVKSRILLARIDAIAGRLQSAAQNARRAVERARSAGDPRLLVQALNALGIALFRRGEWSDCERCLVRADEIALAFGESRWRVATQLALARVHLARGAAERAGEVLARVDRDALRVHGAPVRAVHAEYRALVAHAQGDFGRALTLLDTADERVRRAGIVSYERAELALRRAEILLDLDRAPEAHSACAEAVAELERTGQWLERGHLLRVQARAAQALGRPRESTERRDAAERALRHTGDRFELARCLTDRARAVHENVERRRDAAAEAAHLFRVLELDTLAEEAVDLEIELAGIPSSSPSEPLPRAGHGPVAASDSMRALLVEVSTAAASDSPVLLQGETGTGKEVLARALHDRSARVDAAFVPVNCSAIPESLFEREFFGHARGAFTGADRDAPGLVEAASGGTLFLDEIGEMPLSVQPKLLRLLQEGTFRRVGEVRERHVDLRVVAATNRALFELSQHGRFREDLYYRLSWFELVIPPLRDRLDDVEALAVVFLERERRRLGRALEFDRSTWRALLRFDWPGNVRQLESAVASACVRAGADGRIRSQDLPAQMRRRAPRGDGARSGDIDLQRSLERHERDLILDALRRCGQRRTEAARRLGIGRNTLYEKMKRLGISPEASERSG